MLSTSRSRSDNVYVCFNHCKALNTHRLVTTPSRFIYCSVQKFVLDRKRLSRPIRLQRYRTWTTDHLYNSSVVISLQVQQQRLLAEAVNRLA